MIRKRIPQDFKFTVDLTKQEWTDITEQTLIEPELCADVSMDGPRRQVRWSLADIEDVLGHVAATSNHTEDPKLERRLGKLFDKLQSYLDEHEEYDDDSDAFAG